MFVISCVLRGEVDPSTSETVTLYVDEPMIPEGVERLMRVYSHVMVCMLIHKCNRIATANFAEKKA